MIASQFYYYYKEWTPETSINWVNISWDTIVGWSICTYAYTCHGNVFPVRAELQHAEDRRMKKIANRVIFTLLILYSTIAVTGYLSIPDGTPKIFVNRPPPNSSFNDLAMTIAKAAMAGNLFFAVPLNLNPCRTQVFILMKENLKTVSDLKRYIVTFIILFASAGTAMLIPDIISAIGIIGGICSTSLCSTFPSKFYFFHS